MIAEVVINSNVKTLNRTFDYLVPANLEKELKVGTRVCVPFGNSKKLQDGYVINIKEKTDFKVKEIANISEEYIEKKNLDLALLMARRYFCNISDCIKLMLPPGTSSKNIDNRMSEKMGQFVYLKKEPEEIENEIDEGNIKSPKQIRALRVLEENEGMHIQDLEMLSDTTRAVIKTLEKNEYIEIIEQKIERNPFEFKQVPKSYPLELTDEQQEAFDKVSATIDEKKFEEFLLYGVTGSREN